MPCSSTARPTRSVRRSSSGSLARRGLPIVYDFDDAVFLPNTSEANQAIGSLKNPGKVAEILEAQHARDGREQLPRGLRSPPRERRHDRADLCRHQRLASAPVAASVRSTARGRLDRHTDDDASICST